MLSESTSAEEWGTTEQFGEATRRKEEEEGNEGSGREHGEEDRGGGRFIGFCIVSTMRAGAFTLAVLVVCLHLSATGAKKRAHKAAHAHHALLHKGTTCNIELLTHGPTVVER